MSSIGNVCEQLGLTPRAIRFYEDQGLITSRRDRLNCRSFDTPARDRLRLICKLRQAGLSLSEIREILDALDNHPHTALAGRLIAERLEARRGALAEQVAGVEAAQLIKGEDLARAVASSDPTGAL
jgi:MerR family copper efflux transcriptional regulator